MLNLVVVFALFIAYLSVYISPDKYWIPALFGMAYPFIIVANFFFIVVWLLFKPRNLWFSLIAILIGWSFVSRYVQLNGEEIESGDMKIVSYNVKYFIADNKNTQKENADSIISFLEKQNAELRKQLMQLQTSQIG